MGLYEISVIVTISVQCFILGILYTGAYVHENHIGNDWSNASETEIKKYGNFFGIWILLCVAFVVTLINYTPPIIGWWFVSIETIGIFLLIAFSVSSRNTCRTILSFNSHFYRRASIHGIGSMLIILWVMIGVKKLLG